MQTGEVKIGDVTGVAFARAAVREDRARHGGEQVGTELKAGKFLLVAVQRDLGAAGMKRSGSSFYDLQRDCMV